MKLIVTYFVIGFWLALTAVVSYAEPVPWAGELADPNDPESAINQSEDIKVDDQTYAIDLDPAAPEPLAFGPTDTSIYNISPGEWQVRGDTFNLGLVSDRSIGPSTAVTAPLHLPSGALITSVTIYYNDTGASDPSAGLWCGDTTGGHSIVSNFDPCFPTFSGGNRACTIANINHTLNNASCHYSVLLVLGADNLMYRMRVNYRLQESPAPAFATFSDVPISHPFHQSIEALAASGITTGCGGTYFCPDDFVTRGQMAAFLSRSLGLHWPN